MSQLEIPVTAAPFQEAEVISNKTDNDGHHYLKVLLLSNKMTRNKWVMPYDRIGNLPKHLIDSFIGLPFVGDHDYQYFDKLDKQLYSSGLSDEDINKRLIEECDRVKKGYIDHVFMDDPNSSLLYGQLKITDPKENEYISKYGNPSFKFTSPGLTGYFTEDDRGYMTYSPDKSRAFHLASVPVPAFPEYEAKVKGTCSGNSDSCKRSLAFAGLEPTENVNNNCSCNKNIEQNMSTNPQVTISTPDSAPAASTSVEVSPTGNLLKDSQNTTAEAIQAARAEAQKVIDENNKKQAQAPKLNNEEQNNKEADNDEKNNSEESRLKRELREYKQQLEAERLRNQEQNNFFLEEILSAHIPKAHFKKEEDFNTEKESMKSFINKYNMSLQDAKWLIVKTAKGIPNQNEESGNNKKEGGKHGVGVAGLLSANSVGTTYNSDIVTRSVPKSGSQSESSDIDDYPLGIE